MKLNNGLTVGDPCEQKISPSVTAPEQISIFLDEQRPNSVSSEIVTKDSITQERSLIRV